MEEVIAILKSVRPDVDFETETALIDGGVLDSLDIVNLIAKLDDELGAAIPFTELTPENMNSATAIAQMVERCK